MGKLFRGSPYRKALRAIWWPEWRTWAESHIREELAVIALGVVSGAAAAWSNWRWYAPSEPFNLQAVVLTGVVGGIAALALLFLFKWLAAMLAAPAKLYASQQERIVSLSAELETKNELSRPGEVPRRVNRAMSELFEVYHELEIVRNRTNENLWVALSQRLEEYKAAYGLLAPAARRFHERSEPALTHSVRAMEFERLQKPMYDALDILLNGECEVDLTISQPNPVAVRNRESSRDRFILLNMAVGNREDQAVSLFPVLQLHIHPGLMYATYQADGEPLGDWEEHRRELPRPLTPPLAMPLQLSSKGAATGYWCFFIGNDLEGSKRLQDGQEPVEAVLEIHDLASGRRTKSERFSVGVEQIRLLLSPPPEDEAESEELDARP